MGTVAANEPTYGMETYENTHVPVNEISSSLEPLERNL
jgi:hypothetical protein